MKLGIEAEKRIEVIAETLLSMNMRSYTLAVGLIAMISREVQYEVGEVLRKEKSNQYPLLIETAIQPSLNVATSHMNSFVSTVQKGGVGGIELQFTTHEYNNPRKHGPEIAVFID